MINKWETNNFINLVFDITHIFESFEDLFLSTEINLRFSVSSSYQSGKYFYHFVYDGDDFKKFFQDKSLDTDNRVVGSYMEVLFNSKSINEFYNRLSRMTKYYSDIIKLDQCFITLYGTGLEPDKVSDLFKIRDRVLSEFSGDVILVNINKQLEFGRSIFVAPYNAVISGRMIEFQIMI